MRCKCPGSILVSATTVLFGVLIARVTAADDANPSSAPATSSPAQAPAKESGKSDATQEDSVNGSTLGRSVKSDAASPTPAKRKTSADAASVEAAPTDAAAAKSEPAAEQAKEKGAAAPLEPVPDPLETGPATVEAASFKGVTPGASTKEDVEKAWGLPKEASRKNGSIVQLYSIDLFDRVEVAYAENKVSSIIIRFDRPFPADAVAKQLDLSLIRPVPVSNDLGEILGTAYPERGVLFAFEPSNGSGKTSTKVMQIVLEPVTAETFVLRAETSLEDHPDLSIRDLEQALTLDPNNARAHWLHSRALTATEQHAKAAAAAAEAVRLEPNNPQYHVTRASRLAQAGRLSEAIEEAQKAVATGQKRLHVKARALCVVGDLTASGPKPDYGKAAFVPHASGAGGRSLDQRFASGDPDGSQGSADRRPSRRGSRHRLGRMEGKREGSGPVAATRRGRGRRLHEE